MADIGSAIFNKKAAEKLRSPDDLDKFVRVTNPSVWVALAACAALLLGLLAWGVFGSVTTSVTAKGVVIDGEAMCAVSADEVSMAEVGDDANVGGVKMTVAAVSPIPMSRGEAGSIFSGDYLVDTLMDGDWAYLVTFEGDTSSLDEDVPLNVDITVDRVAPVSLILGGKK